MYDDNRQDASSTNAHMIKMLDNMRQNNQDVSGCTIWDSTDGCSKQYYVSAKYNIIVDRMIGTLGHGKDIVYGINSCEIWYLKVKMCMVSTPEAGDYNKRILAHSIIGNAYVMWNKW